MNFPKKLALAITLILLIGGLPYKGWTQAEVEISSEEPVYTFGESITFNAELQTTNDVQQVLLYLQPANNADVQVYPVRVDSSGNLTTTIELVETPLPAFSEISYWYQVNTADGDTYQSPLDTFAYIDNRTPWRSVSGDQITVYWYAGDLSFGQEVLNVALQGARDVGELLEVFFPPSLDIYVYDSMQAMQAALPDASQYWIAGHADPSQKVILVTLQPGPDQRLEMERQVPHELMHVALNYTDSNAYSNFPAWFNEGLASMVELYPNPEYTILLENAYESGELLPMQDLCRSFPSDPQRALLAYAQSASFTQYLHDQFGESGFNRMMAAYAAGMNCEHGIEEALGKNLADLDESWQQSSFTRVTLGIAFQELLPWLLLLLVVLVGPLIFIGLVIRHRPARKEYE